MKFCLFSVILLFAFTCPKALALSTPNHAIHISHFAKLELHKHISMGSGKLVESVFYSSDLSKVVMIGRSSLLTDPALPKDFNSGSWRLAVSKKKDLLLLTRGLSVRQVDALLAKLDEKWTAQLLRNSFFVDANAEAPCARTPDASALLQKTTDEVFANVSVTNAVKNCDFGLEETFRQIIQSISDTYTNFDIASITKITEAWDALKYAVTELSKDLVKALAPLAAKAPKIVEGLLCEILKEHTAGLAMSVVLPGGVKRLPFELARIVDSVKTVVRSPTILKFIESSKFNHDLRLLPAVFKRMSHVVPETLKAMQFHAGNLARHYQTHAAEFPDLPNQDAYRKRIEEFATMSNNKIIHYCAPGGRCSKLHSETGEYLIVAGDGAFVSFYKLRGNGPQGLFNHFVDKAVGHNGTDKEH